jgi:CheY-like chemotaxis protein
MPLTNRRPGQLRVLVADDNRDNAETTSLRVQQFGYDARAVFDGRQALDAAAEFDPDVVLLDISMPKLTGWDVAREIRRQGARRVALIALTGEYVRQSDRALSKMAGFDQYLTKPFDPVQLRDILQRLAERIADFTKA